MIEKLLCWGLGYTAQFLKTTLEEQDIFVQGTHRNDNLLTPEEILSASHILVSIPPIDGEDLILKHYTSILKEHRNLQWLGYLSSTSVYGDHQGQWVTEESLTHPDSLRSKQRLAIENQWLEFGHHYKLPIHIFRLTGIYGPQRNALERLIKGDNLNIYKPGQVFCRIHILDIVQMLKASMNHPNPGQVYNVTDDEPASSTDVLSFAASLLKIPCPPLIPFEEASLSDFAKEFYLCNRRVSNQKIKEELKIQLLFPTFREGLSDIIAHLPQLKLEN